MKHTLAPIALLVTLPSCVGLNSMIFATKTELAVDLDTRPPTLNVGFDRQEVILAPEFRNGEVHPVLTSIGAGASAFNLFSNQSFATGDSAIILADAFTSDEEYFKPIEKKHVTLDGNSELGVITTMPSSDTEGFWGSLKYLVMGNEHRKRYFFGTDSLLGLKVEWAGTQVPSAVAIGWKRKELAYIPLMEEPELDTNNQPTGKVKIRIPSLLATATVDANAKSTSDSGAQVRQLYATGLAATLLASHPGVRRVLGSAVIPKADEIIERQRKLVANFRESKAAQTTAFSAIKKIWDDNPNKQDDILKLGITDGLVKSDTKKDKFLVELSRLVDGSSEHTQPLERFRAKLEKL